MKQWNELKDKIREGEKFNYILFWSGPYSQWEYSPMVIDGKEYLTAEHYMMYRKALCFGDIESIDLIMSTPSPNDAKQVGRRVKNYDDRIWSDVRYDIVVKGNYHKFTQNEEFKKILLSTDDAVIVEASPHDTIWGIGLGEESKKCLDPLKWCGQNLLGFAIMDVREIIRKEENGKVKSS